MFSILGVIEPVNEKKNPKKKSSKIFKIVISFSKYNSFFQEVNFNLFRNGLCQKQKNASKS